MFRIRLLLPHCILPAPRSWMCIVNFTTQWNRLNTTFTKFHRWVLLLVHTMWCILLSARWIFIGWHTTLWLSPLDNSQSWCYGNGQCNVCFSFKKKFYWQKRSRFQNIDSLLGLDIFQDYDWVQYLKDACVRYRWKPLE